MTPPRPTRYRVIERGRRLEVIDTWKEGGTPAPRGASPQSASRTLGPPAARQGSTARDAVRAMAATQKRGHRHSRVFTTSSWYDAKGPRPIVLGYEGEMRLKGLRFLAGIGCVGALVLAVFFWPMFLVAGFIALTRAGSMRRGIAAWLDKINQPLADSSESAG